MDEDQSPAPAMADAINPPHVDIERTFQWLKLSDMRHASPAEVVIMSNQTTLLKILQTVLRSQENVILAVNKNHGAPHKRRAPVAKKRVYKKTKRVSDATTLAGTEEEGSSEMDVDEDLSENDLDEQLIDKSSLAMEKLASTHAGEAFIAFTKFIDDTNGHLYITRSKGAERSAKAFVEAFTREEAGGDMSADSTGYWLNHLGEMDQVKLFVSMSKKLKSERESGRLL